MRARVESWRAARVHVACTTGQPGPAGRPRAAPRARAGRGSASQRPTRRRSAWRRSAVLSTRPTWCSRQRSRARCAGSAARLRPGAAAGRREPGRRPDAPSDAAAGRGHDQGHRRDAVQPGRNRRQGRGQALRWHARDVRHDAQRRRRRHRDSQDQVPQPGPEPASGDASRRSRPRSPPATRGALGHRRRPETRSPTGTAT